MAEIKNNKILPQLNINAVPNRDIFNQMQEQGLINNDEIYFIGSSGGSSSKDVRIPDAVSSDSGKSIVVDDNGNYILSNVDATGKIDKINPVGTGSFSLNRNQYLNVGQYSIAIGLNTSATGSASYAEGEGTIASSAVQHVQGKYNISNANFIDIIGNGTSDTSRKNIEATDFNGNKYLKGDIYTNCNDSLGSGKKIATEEFTTSQIQNVREYVDQKIAEVPANVFYIGSTAPADVKLLWIDTDTITGGLKYHDGSSWVHVPVAWS